MNDEQQRVMMRSEEATRLLQNPMLVAAFDALEKKYLTGWRNSQGSVPDEREKIYWLITALDEVRAELTRHITDGKIVRKDLEDEAFRDHMRDDESGVTLTYGRAYAARPEV